jgi:hypothetical protein
LHIFLARTKQFEIRHRRPTGQRQPQGQASACREGGEFLMGLGGLPGTVGVQIGAYILAKILCSRVLRHVGKLAHQQQVGETTDNGRGKQTDDQQSQREFRSYR